MKWLLSAACLAALMTSVYAQEQCGTREQVFQALSAYGESPADEGMSDGTAIIQLWLAPGNATWSIVAISPDGAACVIAGGKDWDRREPAAPQGPTL